MNTEHAQKETQVGFRSSLHHQSSFFERVANVATGMFGKTEFFVGNILFFLVWVLWNLEFIPGLAPFDPYPFGLLTMIVSLEAIILSIALLIVQNRESEIADLREEIDFEVNVRAENEITKILNMLDEIHDHLGLPKKDDTELRSMKKKTNIEAIKEEILRRRG